MAMAAVASAFIRKSEQEVVLAAVYPSAYSIGYVVTSEMLEDDLYGVAIRKSPYITDPTAWFMK